MKIFLNTGFFIFLINGYLNPIYASQNINHNISTNQKNFKNNLHKESLIVNKDNSKNQVFTFNSLLMYSRTSPGVISLNKDKSSIRTFFNSSFPNLID